MVRRPTVVAFDVIETLFPLQPLRPRLQGVGLPPDALGEWFARVLRDAFALDATDVFKTFQEVATSALEGLMAEHAIPPDADKVKHVMAGFAELTAHPDVQPAFQMLHDAGVRVVTLSNGNARSTEKLLKDSHLDGLIERVITIEEVQHWKPRREVYLHAAKVVGVSPDQAALVAVHSWDVHGAHRAGLVTGWVSRREKRFPSTMKPPSVQGETLTEVSRALLALPSSSR